MRWRKRRKWSYSLQNKVESRKNLLNKRAAVTIEYRKAAAQTALTLLLESPLFATSQNIACYFAQDKEFDCTPFINAVWQANKQCYLPVLSSQNKNHLEFVSYHKNDTLRLNRYNILEPQKAEHFHPENLDLVLIPLVGFDLNGHRLGMGGGYYDRTFNFLKEKKYAKPYLLGLAYALQQAEIPHDAWDISLDGVLTEERLILFRSMAAI